MGLFNGIKTRKLDKDLVVFESVGNYKVYEPDSEIWEEIIEMFKDVEQNRNEDGEFVSTFGKESTIKLFRLLTNIDMTEKLYNEYATKRNVRLALVQQYLVQVIQSYIKLGFTAAENEKLSDDLGVEKPKNRNDKTVILEQMKQNEAKRKEEQGVVAELIEGEFVQGANSIYKATKNLEDMTDEELDIEIARLEKIAKIKKLKAESGE